MKSCKYEIKSKNFTLENKEYNIYIYGKEGMLQCYFTKTRIYFSEDIEQGETYIMEGIDSGEGYFVVIYVLLDMAILV